MWPESLIMVDDAHPPGKLILRAPPDVHAAVATAAQIRGKSINQWASEILDQASHI